MHAPNGYLSASAENFVSGIPFIDPNFLMENDISALRRHLPLIFAFNKLNVCHVFISGLADLLT